MIVDTAFGKNDIRGIYGKDVTEELFYYTGRGYISYLSNNLEKNPSDIWVTVCRDARTHSPALVDSLIKGVRSTGANVVDLGLAPTPIGYYSEVAGVPTFAAENTYGKYRSYIVYDEGNTTNIIGVILLLDPSIIRGGD